MGWNITEKVMDHTEQRKRDWKVSPVDGGVQETTDRIGVSQTSAHTSCRGGG